ncbi:mis18-binding protein 1-like isoform X1 [Trematomus bernacchii]|uniref:mis18-binding protein 1-like isoform X1 n=1 Tax=Trematomus bernacchii TaxID=40690 RepID=UPI00146CB6FF|nr:mis18-binding protein 1-like isoform X1 [Trematomus bernacchii]
MASYQHISKHTNPQFESPARVFAKLKSKVREENPSANQWTFPGKEPLSGIREKHGGVFKSPRKRSESTWMTEQFKENKRSSSYRDEAEALTLSPISSPQKGFGYWFSDINSERVEEVPLGGHGCTPRKRAFLESTALSIRPPIHTEPAQIRDSAGFHGFSRTSVKRQPLEHDFVNSVFGEGYPPVDKRMPPPFMLSPTINRLRKRTWEPQEFDKVSSCRKVSNESHPQPGEDVGNVRGFSADQSEMDQFTHEPVVSDPQSLIAMKRCFVAVKRYPPMSPAKMFATMKKRESKIEQQVNKVSNCTRDLFFQDNFHLSRDRPLFKAHNMSEMEDNVLRDFPENVVPVNRPREASADSQSETDPSENVPNPVLSPQPFLHEDPLVLNSPRVSIPKKEAVFKRNNWRQCIKFPCESVIHLKKWFLKRDRNGLFLGGTHRDANVPWNSSILVERVSNTVVKSASGSVYILIGKMCRSVDTEFPKWLLKKFATGFPPNWEALYEKLLSESRDDPSSGTDRNSEKRSVLSKTNPYASTIHSVKRQKQKFLKTPDFCPSAPLTQAKVSRSGRVLRAPLEYWKGGRVFMDAHMNVTIHACYQTSISLTNDTTTVSTKTSQKPARSEGRKQREPVNNKEASVPLRRVKAPPRRHTRAKVKPDENLSDSLEHLSTSDTTSPLKNVRRRKQIAPRSLESSASASSQDEVNGRKKMGTVQRKSGRRIPQMLHTSDSSTSSEEDLVRGTRGTRKKQKQSTCTKSPSPPKPSPKLTKFLKKKPKAKEGKAPHLPEQDEDKWTEAELMKLQKAVSYFPKDMSGYWAKVARMVGTRSAEECHCQHTWQGTSQTPEKTARKQTGGKKKEKVKATEDPVTDRPLISAGLGTFKRKQQVREFLEAIPKEDVDDAFSSEYMQRKRFEVPSMCQSEDDFNLSEMEPLSPTSTVFPEVKTPQGLHITPGMIGSLNRTNNEKYVHKLQRRMKMNQFQVCKQAPSSTTFKPTPSVKQAMRRCANTENDSFVVWEMFPEKDAVLSESGEEEDFYFSDNA